MFNTIWYGVRTFPPTAPNRRVISEFDALVPREVWERARAIILGRK